MFCSIYSVVFVDEQPSTIVVVDDDKQPPSIHVVDNEQPPTTTVVDNVQPPSPLVVDDEQPPSLPDNGPSTSSLPVGAARQSPSSVNNKEKQKSYRPRKQMTKSKVLKKRRGTTTANAAVERQQPAQSKSTKNYDDDDITVHEKTFEPNRVPGAYINESFLRSSKEIEFFQLFFDNKIIETIVENTNKYAWANISKKQSYADKNGAWVETTPAEIKNFISLIIYQALVKVPTYDRYWSTKSLYHGLWAREIMTMKRFKALLAMLHVVDPFNEKDGDKLRKVGPFINNFKAKCKEFYQPSKNIAVDERLVKSKHRSGIRQYIKNKPVKFGIKLWVLADSQNGYTVDFYVYAGKNDSAVVANDLGLGYNVVMKLAEPYLNQGYHLFCDNFYTSPTLVKDLFIQGTHCCGTTTQNRKGYPDTMKDGSSWAKKESRGAMRWNRDGDCVAVQWKDNKLVTILSSIDSANLYVEVTRKKKEAGKWSTVSVRQPKCVQRYNKYMNGVDRSDQYLAKYNSLRKCIRWWKTLFFHMVDISLVNGFILFKHYQNMHPEIACLQRPKRYSVLEFREAVLRQLIGLNEFGDPPIYKANVNPQPKDFICSHLPQFSDTKRNCKLCYMKTKKELKIHSFCSTCNVHLHVTKQNNCFAEWHSSEFHQK